MKKLTQTLAIFLVFAMLLAAVSCANNTPNNETETTTEAETKEDIFSYLPSETYDGKTLSMGIGFDYLYDSFVADKSAKDITSQAVYKRNLDVSEYFDIDLKIDTKSYDDRRGYQHLVDLTLTDEHVYDLFGSTQNMFCIPLMQKCLYNWNDFEYISMNEPWWQARFNDRTEINGKLFGIAGSMDPSMIQNLGVIFFNMELLPDFGLSEEEIYNVVNEGKWTIDYLSETIKTMYRDLDRDGERSKGDIFGYAYGLNAANDSWITAFGESTTAVNEANELSISLLSEKTLMALDKVIDLTWNNPGTAGTADMYGESFMTGNIVFMPGRLLNSFDSLRKTKFAYGILPFPKYNEDQAEYHSLVLDCGSLWCVPVTLPEEDMDFVSIITDAFAKYTYLNLIPVFYDEALKNKYSEDPETAKMVDLIYESSDFEFSFIYSMELFEMPYFYRYCIESGTNDLSTRVNRNTRNVNKKLSKIYDLYFD